MVEGFNDMSSDIYVLLTQLPVAWFCHALWLLLERKVEDCFFLLEVEITLKSVWIDFVACDHIRRQGRTVTRKTFLSQI